MRLAKVWQSEVAQPGRCEALECDLNSLASVAAFADKLNDRGERVSLLINNGGVFNMAGPRTETVRHSTTA